MRRHIAPSAGLNATHAANVVAYRQQHGPFRRRQDLLKVPRLGPVTFERAAGFLRILGQAPAAGGRVWGRGDVANGNTVMAFFNGFRASAFLYFLI